MGPMRSQWILSKGLMVRIGPILLAGTSGFVLFPSSHAMHRGSGVSLYCFPFGNFSSNEKELCPYLS